MTPWSQQGLCQARGRRAEASGPATGCRCSPRRSPAARSLRLRVFPAGPRCATADRRKARTPQRPRLQHRVMTAGGSSDGTAHGRKSPLLCASGPGELLELRSAARTEPADGLQPDLQPVRVGRRGEPKQQPLTSFCHSAAASPHPALTGARFAAECPVFKTKCARRRRPRSARIFVAIPHMGDANRTSTEVEPAWIGAK